MSGLFSVLHITSRSSTPNDTLASSQRNLWWMFVGFTPNKTKITCLDVSKAFLWIHFPWLLLPPCTLTHSLAFIRRFCGYRASAVMLLRFDKVQMNQRADRMTNMENFCPRPSDDSFHSRGVLFFDLSVNYFFYVRVIFHCKFSILSSLALSPARRKRQATPWQRRFIVTRKQCSHRRNE